MPLSRCRVYCSYRYALVPGTRLIVPSGFTHNRKLSTSPIFVYALAVVFMVPLPLITVPVASSSRAPEVVQLP